MRGEGASCTFLKFKMLENIHVGKNFAEIIGKL